VATHPIPRPQRVRFADSPAMLVRRVAKAWQNETAAFANPLFSSALLRPQRDLKSLIGNREIHWRDADLPRKPRQFERFEPLGAVPPCAVATRRVEPLSAASWQNRGKTFERSRCMRSLRLLDRYRDAESFFGRLGSGTGRARARMTKSARRLGDQAWCAAQTRSRHGRSFR
jgi:hypothetical protein